MIATMISYRYTVTAALLFVIGLAHMMLQTSLIKKVVGFNIMDAATFLFLAAQGYLDGRTAAILTDGGANVARYVNPIPAGLVLTGIVVSVSVTAVMLALSVRLYRRYHTLDIDEITAICRKEE